MSTTIDALRNLGLKVNGTEPVSNYTGNIINEIAENYTGGGGGGSGIYTFDFTGATGGEYKTGYKWTKAINQATMLELLDQPVIDLTFDNTVSNVLETSHAALNKGPSDCFETTILLESGSAAIGLALYLSQSAAELQMVMLEIPEGSGTQVYKHTVSLTVDVGALVSITEDFYVLDTSTAISNSNIIALWKSGKILSISHSSNVFYDASSIYGFMEGSVSGTIDALIMNFDASLNAKLYKYTMSIISDTVTTI